MSTSFLQQKSKLFELILEKIDEGVLDYTFLNEALEKAFEEASSDNEFDLLVSSFLSNQELSFEGQPHRTQQYELVLEEFKKKHQELISLR